jgi:hypothetical protein
MLAMLNWSWGTWPDPLVDFGAQLYVPWQLVTGHTLYRDVAYYNGPLSSYFNAAAFRLLGVGMSTLVWVNLCILGMVMVIAYRLTVRASGRASAVMCGLTFVLIFAFGQTVPIGNYNWVTPYTHELTHGAALGLAAIACAERFGRGGRLEWLAAAGVLLGMVFLTKAEPTAASFAAVGALLAGGWWVQETDRRLVLRELAVVVGCAVAPPLIAWLLLSAKMPASLALRGVLGSWPWALDRRITSLHFYRAVAGLDDVSRNLRILGLWLMVWLAILAVGIGGGLLVRSARHRLLATVLMGAGTASVILWRWPSSWSGVATPLPLFVIFALFVTAAAVLRRAHAAAPLRLALTVFAAILLAKMGLTARVYHYGFVLAWPATAVLVCAMTGDLPMWVQRRGGSATVFRAVMLPAWLAVVSAMLLKDSVMFGAKRNVIAAGTVDEFRGDRRALGVQRVCGRVDQLVPRNGTVLVLPQGLMVNYLTRRQSPTPYVNFMPPEVLAAGEQTIVDALRRHCPDCVVLTPAVIENGFFTLDDRDPYGSAVLSWVRRNYVPADAAEGAASLQILIPSARAPR